jgi:NSS family neurotransmitter:Na+ symporter
MIDRGVPRKKAVIINVVLMIVLSVPCALGFNVWSGFQPLGPGTGVLDLEDFFVSNNLLPIGALIYLAFCCTKMGWGWDNFIAEVDAGKGLKFPKGKAIRFYLTYVVPVVIIVIFIAGYWNIFKPLIMGK